MLAAGSNIEVAGRLLAVFEMRAAEDDPLMLEEAADGTGPKLMLAWEAESPRLELDIPVALKAELAAVRDDWLLALDEETNGRLELLPDAPTPLRAEVAVEDID